MLLLHTDITLSLLIQEVNMASHGIKIAKQGNNVSTAADRDLVFTSKYPVFKVQAEYTGNLSLTTDGVAAEGTTTITHNLGYQPAFMWFLEHDTTGRQWQMPLNRTSDAVFWGYSTTTIVRIGGFVFSGTNRTFPFKVLVFIDEVPI